MKRIKGIRHTLSSHLRPKRSRTIRYTFPLVFTAVAFLGATAFFSEESSYIHISTHERSVNAGELFSIDVSAGAHVPVNTVDIRVGFPEDQIEIDGIDVGQSVITIWTVDPYVDGNEVVLQGGTFRKGFLGEHLIATINARAKESGVAKFTIDKSRFLAGDGRGTSVTITDTGYESLTMYVDVEALEGETSDGVTKLGGSVAIGIYTDINRDGGVDMNDVLSFMSAWRSEEQAYDFNQDGRMSFVDFAIILADSFFK